MSYPAVRLRRLRENPVLRRMVEQTRLSPRDLVQPLFVKEGISKPVPILSMPGQFQHSLQSVAVEAQKISTAGIPAVLLFGIPAKKDLRGKNAVAANGIVQKSVAAIKKTSPKLLVITDVCLCEYLSHGHCGHLKAGRVVNDSTVRMLARVAVSHARAGADIVAPSDMMDGRVAAIRKALDANRFEAMPILSYAVKYASGFYSPFREAAENTPESGDRKGYQMNPANRREALREAAADLEEGADILMVKPALSYLDVIRDVRDHLKCPVAAYSVSGEYSMIRAAAARGWIDEKKIVMETHLSMKRAGASFLVTYWAQSMARWTKHE